MNNKLKRPVSDSLDFSLMAVGFWMLFSPALLHFSSEQPEGWLSVTAGFAVIVLAFAVRRAFHNWELWLAAIVGAVLIALPWIAGFNAGSKVTLNAVFCGAIIVIAAGGRWYAHAHGMDKGPTAA